VALKADFPALHQRADSQIKQAVGQQAHRMRAGDQVKHRLTDDHRILPCRVINRHHFRRRAVNREEILLLFNQAEDLSGQGLIIVEEFEQDG